MKKISIVINARTQSTRVPNKLIRKFSNSTLIDIALDKMNKMDFFEHKYLAVAEENLIQIGSKYESIEILNRDISAVKKGVNPLTLTFQHYLKIPTDYIFVFNPCLPCIKISTIKLAFDYFQNTNYNSYTAVIPTGDWIFDSEGNALTNKDAHNVTTNKEINYFKGCHAFHIINKKYFKENNILWTFEKNNPHIIEIPSNEAIDIDTIDEFNLAELIYNQTGAHG
jgi:CMP-N-acetylneuraminic acid synthetase